MRRSAIAGYVLLALALTLATIGILRAAWLCDDAYITLRTVDNWVHGHGLRWNIDERVQTYTHPLWMFLVSLFYLFTREPYYTTLFVSVLCAVGGLTVIGLLVARNRWTGIAAVLAAAASHAFIDYSTSGLENPLSDLLLALFAWILFRNPRRPHRLRWLALVAALAMLNRSDHLLLVGPALAWEVLSLRSRQAIREALIGLTPLLAWELFSFVYYGSLVPNTAYAKLHHQVAHKVVLAQGMRWVWYTLSLDWVTVAVIAAAAVGAIWQRHLRGLVCVAGCLAYVFYAVWIGGDFMGGRFWLSPFMLALCYLAQCPLRASLITLGVTLASTLLLPLRTGAYGGNSRDALGYHQGVWDERHSYFDALGLVNVGLHATGPLHEWGRWGVDEGRKPFPTTVRSAVGMHGYYSGPKLHIIDDLALADPLLARLRPLNHNEMTVGHFKRHLPAGYFDSVLGHNVIVDPNLHEYYAHIAFITRGPLLSPSRLYQALMLMLGRYDHLVQAYEDSLDHAKKDLDRLQIFAPEGEGPECTTCMTFYGTAELLLATPVVGAINCAAVLDRDRGYRIELMFNDLSVGEAVVGPIDGSHGLYRYKFAVPRTVNGRGFNRVFVEANRGPAPFSFGGVECVTAGELP